MCLVLMILWSCKVCCMMSSSGSLVVKKLVMMGYIVAFWRRSCELKRSESVLYLGLWKM
jgi:hypothetical protein